jgi:tRNA(fMet)-specific endonuclease VapC
VTVAELVHGAYRTKTQAQQQRRLEFIERLSSDVPVHPVTLDIARLAGRIEGQQEGLGVQFAFGDLVIGATALHLGYQVATLNLRDFQRIPGRFRHPNLNVGKIPLRSRCRKVEECAVTRIECPAQ